MMDDKNYVTFRQNPDIDILFGNVNKIIPSKREDFKPINVKIIKEDGEEEILDNFYVKKPSTKSVVEFENYVRQQISEPSLDYKKILKPSIVEVVIAITVSKKKFFEIDLDNIAKTVLDTLKGHLFEDDSQVANLVCRKDTHKKNMNGFFIAVTELLENRKGILGDFYLLSEVKE